MKPTTQAAMERLDALLAAPVSRPSRHSQIGELAREHVNAPQHDGMVTKAVAAVEPEPTREAKLTGEFEALVSDFEVDREGDRFDRHAFDNAIAKIRKAGRPIPVLFGHSQESLANVLGMIPSDGLWTDDEGLHARGWIDVSTDVGMRLHELVRRDVLNWSIGFTLKRADRARDGVRVLREVGELLELSLTPVPANPRTRTAGAKSNRVPPSLDELRERELTRELGLEDPELVRIRDETRELMLNAMTYADAAAAGNGKAAETLREKSERIAREHAPIEIATFEC